jgi:hypothetical protein
MRRYEPCAVVKKNILPFTVTLQSKLWPQRFRVLFLHFAALALPSFMVPIFCLTAKLHRLSI